MRARSSARHSSFPFAALVPFHFFCPTISAAAAAVRRRSRHMPVIVRCSCGRRPWKKCPQPGNTMIGQLLRPRPREYRGQRDDIVLLAMDHDRVGGNRRRRQSAWPPGRRAPCARRRRSRRRVSARTSRTKNRPARPESRHKRSLACASAASASAVSPTPSSNAPFGFADAAKIEAHAGIAKREEGLGERLHDLVLERAALLRVRMGDERNPARSGVRGVDHQLQRAGGAFDDQALGSLWRQIRSLSTISPPTTWRSMISSMSARST